MYDFPVHDCQQEQNGSLYFSSIFQMHFYSRLCQERLLRSRKFATMATLQVGTILVTMAPEILELATCFVKKSP